MKPREEMTGQEKEQFDMAARAFLKAFETLENAAQRKQKNNEETTRNDKP